MAKNDISKNPNNCVNCDHRKRELASRNGIGFCYVFNKPPTQRCYQHTLYTGSLNDLKIMMKLMK